MARRKKTQQRAQDIQSQVLDDPFRDFEGSPLELGVAKFFYFIRSHWKEFAMGGGVAFLVIVSFITYSLWTDIEDERSVLAFEKLLKEPIMKPGSGAEDAAVKRLNEYEQSFTSDRAHMRASIHKFKLLVSGDRKKEAVEIARELSVVLDTPELRVYFNLQMGILYEDLLEHAKALDAYTKAREMIIDDNLLKAMALFGEGRTSIALGKREDGLASIRRMMQMNDVENIDQLRITATAFLLKSSKNP